MKPLAFISWISALGSIDGVINLDLVQAAACALAAIIAAVGSAVLAIYHRGRRAARLEDSADRRQITADIRDQVEAQAALAEQIALNRKAIEDLERRLSCLQLPPRPFDPKP